MSEGRDPRGDDARDAANDDARDAAGGSARDATDGHVDVVALALGDVDGQRRAAMTAHLLACAACRSEYDDVSATIGDVLPAVPGVQPPMGFDERVLERFGTVADAAARRSLGRRHPRGRRVPRWRWLAGAAALLLVAAGVVGLVATRGDDDASAGDVRTLEKIDGEAVGTVSIGEVGGEQVMVVAIVAAPDGVSYYCRTHLDDGSTVDSESWPAGNGAWLVPLPDAGEQAVRSVDVVVSGTDHVWSSATFATT